MRFRLLLAGLVFLGLAACTSGNTLTTEQISSLGISGVQVTISPKANISGTPDGWYYRRTPGDASPPQEGQAGKQLEAIVQAEYDKHLKPYFQGARKVRVDVTVDSLSIPSITKRILLSDKASFTASLAVVNLQTGTVLARLDTLTIDQHMGSGPIRMTRDAVNPAGRDPTATLVMRHATAAREWLAKNTH